MPEEPATESTQSTDAAVSCSWCGTTVEAVPLTWTSSFERGALRYYCDRCSREHLRSIEGKLDTEHW